MFMEFGYSVREVGRRVWINIMTAKRKNKKEVYIRNISLKIVFWLLKMTHGSQININMF